LAEDGRPIRWKDLVVSYEGEKQTGIVFRNSKSGKVIFRIDHADTGYAGKVGIYRSAFGDQKEEIMKYNEIFYNGEWSVDSLYVGGFSEIVFPEYTVLDRDKSGRYYFLDVTFEKPFRSVLNSYFIFAEKKMPSVFDNTNQLTIDKVCCNAPILPDYFNTIDTK